MGLAGQIWDYAPEIQDVGMTDEFAQLFAARAVARISDPEEMRPAFDSDEEEGDGGDDGDDGDDGGGGRERGARGRRGDKGRRGDRGVDRVVRQAVIDRGRGGLAIGAGGEGRVGEVLAAVGGDDEPRRPTQRRRTDVLPPPALRIGRVGGVPPAQVPLQVRVPSHMEDAQIRTLQITVQQLQAHILTYQW